MKLILVCCVLVAVTWIEVSAKMEPIVAADPNIQKRTNSQDRLIVHDPIAAERNTQSRTDQQIRLKIDHIVAADQKITDRTNQQKLQWTIENVAI